MQAIMESEGLKIEEPVLKEELPIIVDEMGDVLGDVNGAMNGMMIGRGDS